MAPTTHLLASWLIAAKATRNPRDCRLVTLAGILPDLDGLGLVVDAVARSLGHKTMLYAQYHHYLMHGIAAGAGLALILAALARDRWRVAVLTLLVFHLHVLADLAGSRGPSPEDLWPVFYLGPFTHEPMWIWTGQWRLDGWFNRLLTVALFIWALGLAPVLGHSVLGVFNRRADATFVGVLRQWRERARLAWAGRRFSG